MDTTAMIGRYLERSVETKRATAKSLEHCAVLAEIARAFADTVRRNGKVMLCGNGGSAADAQHVATELVVRLSARRERKALPALALTTDTSLITACANDYAFDDIFARQVEALGRSTDLLVGISTSGGSKNVIRAFEAAKRLGIRRVLFTGGSGGALATMCELTFCAPSKETSHIQEVHLAAYHATLFAMEEILFGPEPG